MLRFSALAVTALTMLAACGPTATPTSNATANAAATGGPTPNCGFAANQTSNDVRMNCTISGPLPNTLVDLANSGNSTCSHATLSLFGQNMAATLAVIYGENGDENIDRVRLGTTISGGTHSGSLAKASGSTCGSSDRPFVPVNTTFAGQHIALIDKSQVPACVFQSRLTLSSFDQTIGEGLSVLPGAPVGRLTRSSVENLIGQKVDLQLAISISNMLRQNADTTEPGFVGRSGRCANNYQAFTGN